jgi:hypothetical protein
MIIVWSLIASGTVIVNRRGRRRGCRINIDRRWCIIFGLRLIGRFNNSTNYPCTYKTL